jgi:uncharacterized membrane protein HdeD (DUF308 family)
MELSIFFAKLIGLFFLILVVLMLLRKQQIENFAKEFFATKGLLFFAGVINLLFGLTIAISHPIWEWNWRGLITLLGYLAILKGIVRIGFPDQDRTVEPKMMGGYWIIVVVLAILGVYLTYSGFTA